MQTVEDIFSVYARGYDQHREGEMTLSEFLEGCRDDPMKYATATERLLAAIGEPQMRGGQRAEFPDGIGQRECAVFTNVLAQDVREGSIGTRVRMLLAE